MSVPNFKNTSSIISGLVLLFIVFYLMIIASKQNLDPNTMNTYTTTFTRVDGLKDGSKVYANGFLVGQVTDLKLDKYYNVVVSMMVTKDISIPSDSSAVIHMDDLSGNKTINIEIGLEEDILNDNDIIENNQSAMILEELLTLSSSNHKAKAKKKAKHKAKYKDVDPDEFEAP